MIRHFRRSTERVRIQLIKTAICFTDKGLDVINRLNDAAKAAGIEQAAVIGHASFDEAVSASKKAFGEGSALIFVGALGIAVRAISGIISDKLSDAPVVVIDDNAKFVIPVVSGHAGGANKLAATIAKLLDAIPVITTSTDVNEAFSADVFAIENHLTIRTRDGIKKVSAKALAGKPVTISIKDYPPREPVDIVIADETDREYSLLLSPKPYVIGIGMRKDKDPAKCENSILTFLHDNGIDIADVYALATIDIKQEEPAIHAFSQKYRIPVIAFEAAVLAKAEGEFTPSEFVEQTVGVDNVCERAALLAAGPGARIVHGKHIIDGITLAVSYRRAEVNAL